LGATGVSGAALFQPPKSSSSAIFGGLGCAPDFDVPEVVVRLGAAPQAKSLSGAFAVGLDWGLGAGGSGVAQASAAEKLEKEDVVVADAKGVDFGGGCAGVER
jgi:hypothetical protein